MSFNIFTQIIFIIIFLFNIVFINSDEAKTNNGDELTNLYMDFASEWESKMQDYVYDYLYYIPLNPKEQEIYFENVTSVPTTFKGSYFLSDESTNKIEFYIRDSNDKIIHKAVGHHNIFEINITKIDRYSMKIIGKYMKYINIVLLLEIISQKKKLWFLFR